jgi:hypothetical protein
MVSLFHILLYQSLLVRFTSCNSRKKVDVPHKHHYGSEMNTPVIYNIECNDERTIWCYLFWFMGQLLFIGYAIYKCNNEIDRTEQEVQQKQRHYTRCSQRSNNPSTLVASESYASSCHQPFYQLGHHHITTTPIRITTTTSSRSYDDPSSSSSSYYSSSSSERAQRELLQLFLYPSSIE